jgi:hypothetical protein
LEEGELQFAGEKTGYKTTKGHFLHGVFYVPSFSKATVPELQTVFMADA